MKQVTIKTGNCNSFDDRGTAVFEFPSPYSSFTISPIKWSCARSFLSSTERLTGGDSHSEADVFVTKA